MTAIYDGDDFEGPREQDFFTYLRAGLTALGKTAAEKLLVAYYVMLDKKTPAWAKARIAGALVYFGFPIDAIPDVTPVVGFTDDLGMLALALVAVAESIRWRHVRSARKRLTAWGLDLPEVPKTAKNDDRAEGFED